MGDQFLGALIGALLFRTVQQAREQSCSCSDDTKRAQVDKATWIGAGVGFLLAPAVKELA